jgi:hypothetical protein
LPGGRRRSGREAQLDPYFLAGAIVGSGLYVFFGRAPARRLLEVVRRRISR